MAGAVLGVLEVGSGFEGGRRQGRALGPLIRSHLKRLYRSWRRAGVEQPEAYGRELLRVTGFRSTVVRTMPRLLAEVDGIAEGAGLSADEAFLLQLIDEEWAWRRRSGEKCSSFAISDAAAGVVRAGQNIDLPAYADGLQALVLHTSGEAPRQLVFTTAGVLGLLGVNSAGVAVCVNAMPHLRSQPEGAPVAFVVRRLLEARSASEAVDFALGLPHATNQHYLVADRTGFHALEASADGVVRYVPPWPDRVFHTNHALAHPAGAPASVNSIERLDTLVERLSRGRPGLKELQAALSSADHPDHPLCVPRKTDGEAGELMTAGAFISELSADGTVRGVYSFGPPSERGWRPWRLG